MNVKYFGDTDTVSENVYVDLEKDGNLVSMTIEHAKENASLPSVQVEKFQQGIA